VRLEPYNKEAQAHLKIV